MNPQIRKSGGSTPRQAYLIDKIGFLKGVWRYLGFQKIRVTHARPHFSGQTNRHRHLDKTLKGRRISVMSKEPSPNHDGGLDDTEAELFKSVCNRFQGYRTTTGNIQSLAHELTENMVADENKAVRADQKLKVELSLILCGLSQIHKKNRTLESTGIRHAFSRKKLSQLGQFLQMPLQQLVKEAYNSNVCNNDHLNTLYAEHPAVLGERACQEPMKAQQDIVTRMNICQNYLVHGEGRQVLERCGFSDVDKLERLLPSIPQSINSPEALEIVQSLLSVTNDENEVPYQSLQVSGIQFEPGVVKKNYDPSIPEHRFLVVLLELQNLYAGLYSGYGMHASLQNEDVGTKLNNEDEKLRHIFTGAAHAVMKKTFPDVCRESSYQQFHLKTNSGQVRWNSDYAQPRGGWKEKQSFEAVEQQE